MRRHEPRRRVLHAPARCSLRSRICQQVDERWRIGGLC